MKVVSLFSGAGGLDLAAEEAGADVIFSNDIDLDSTETLKKYFPKTEVIHKDISEITTFPNADLLIGGYPCQSFSMGGNRDPENDKRSYLYLHFKRALDIINPKFFIAENVSGLRQIQKGNFLEKQQEAFSDAGKHGYYLTWQLLNARDFGVPQVRKRIIMVGIRKDLGLRYVFPNPTHGDPSKKKQILLPYTSHGDAIKNLPLWPDGEFYERPHDPEGHWSWYYMSRNRKKNWDEPSFTIVANWRHITLHPASPVMKLTWSNLADGFKQRWDFSDEYEHLLKDGSLPKLETPRRLSWRECAAIQTFPDNFEPHGSIESKFRQIGNAVPILLGRKIIEHITKELGLIPIEEVEKACWKSPEQLSLLPYLG